MSAGAKTLSEKLSKPFKAAEALSKETEEERKKRLKREEEERRTRNQFQGVRG